MQLQQLREQQEQRTKAQQRSQQQQKQAKNAHLPRSVVADAWSRKAYRLGGGNMRVMDYGNNDAQVRGKGACLTVDFIAEAPESTRGRISTKSERASEQC